MAYRLSGLDPTPFRPLFALDDAGLAAAGAQRVVADSDFGYPCRASLADAAEGETLILLSHAHLTADGSPYRASGPIFVRETAETAAELVDTLPPYLTRRMLSLRAYDAAGIMVDADVVAGEAADGLIARLLARDDVAMIHAHFARRGCYAARIARA